MPVFEDGLDDVALDMMGFLMRSLAAEFDLPFALGTFWMSRVALWLLWKVRSEVKTTAGMFLAFGVLGLMQGVEHWNQDFKSRVDTWSNKKQGWLAQMMLRYQCFSLAGPFHYGDKFGFVPTPSERGWDQCLRAWAAATHAQAYDGDPGVRWREFHRCRAIPPEDEEAEWLPCQCSTVPEGQVFLPCGHQNDEKYMHRDLKKMAEEEAQGAARCYTCRVFARDLPNEVPLEFCKLWPGGRSLQELAPMSTHIDLTGECDLLKSEEMARILGRTPVTDGRPGCWTPRTPPAHYLRDVPRALTVTLADLFGVMRMGLDITSCYPCARAFQLAFAVLTGQTEKLSVWKSNHEHVSAANEAPEGEGGDDGSSEEDGSSSSEDEEDNPLDWNGRDNYYSRKALEKK